MTRAARKTGKVSIISRESDERTLDIAMLEAELRRRGIEVRVLSRLLTKEKSLKALGYAGHVLKQEAAILGSDVVVLDTYCIPASMIPHRKGTKVVQIWHALSAIKKFGWQTVGKEGGSSERVAKLMRMHHGYDYIVSPSDITAKHFCEAFRTAPDKVVKYGLPRIDYIKSVALGERRDGMLKRIYARYPELKDPDASDKRTVLYAPTFRRGEAVSVDGLIEALDPEKYDLVVKLHPLYRVDGAKDPSTPLRCAQDDSTGCGPAQDDASPAVPRSEEPKKLVVIYDDEFSSYDWLAAADMIISDYSSFVVEATLADRPLFIYAYDFDEYSRNTGLNIDFDAEPIAPYVFRDAEKLAVTADAVNDKRGIEEGFGAQNGYDMDALHAFRDRYIDIETGAAADGAGTRDPEEEKFCTARLADFIESLI